MCNLTHANRECQMIDFFSFRHIYYSHGSVFSHFLKTIKYFSKWLILAIILGGFGAIMGFPVSMSAACGMIAVFAGATNCPIAAILIAMEMFQGEGLPFFAITVAISFILSQHLSLYTAQRFNFDIKKAS